ncbi:MAG: hypothetical protein HQ574_01775 [Chloroflexi bacterium]|nr:hypothetical protein [Chloroflexota bacterium]
MKNKITIAFGMILLLLVSAGCQSDSLKASYFQSEPETTSLEESTEDPVENPETNCAAINPHPVAEGMAETYQITYEEVMTLYCDGFAFSDILLALETTTLVDQSPEDLLALLETRTWEEIWADLGVNQE